jgi:hypothetical protein
MKRFAIRKACRRRGIFESRNSRASRVSLLLFYSLHHRDFSHIAFAILAGGEQSCFRSCFRNARGTFDLSRSSSLHRVVSYASRRSSSLVSLPSPFSPIAFHPLKPHRRGPVPANQNGATRGLIARDEGWTVRGFRRDRQPSLQP